MILSGDALFWIIIGVIAIGIKEGIKENKKKQRYRNRRYNKRKNQTKSPSLMDLIFGSQSKVKYHHYDDTYKKPTYKDFNTSDDSIISPQSKHIDIPRNETRSKAKKGIEYESHIAEIYRNRGYQVWERGKELGRKDGGIDLVACKDDETILIQCKDWDNRHRWKIRQKDIRAFRTDCRDFLENHRQYIRKNIIGRYVISDRILDKGAYAYIKSTDKLDFEIIPSPEKEFTQPY